MRKKLSTYDIADAVGVRQPTISRIENASAKASSDLADRIAKFLGNAVTRDQILFPKDYESAGAPPSKPIRQPLKKAS